MQRKYLLLFLIILNYSFVLTAKNSLDEIGYASWYGGKFQGRLTANGEVFDTYKFTAAHKTLPFNTIVKVTNISNKKTVIVRINDRGPFIKNRIIDLSKVAAEALDMINSGTAYVKVEIVEQVNEIDKNKSALIQIAAYKNIEYANKQEEAVSYLKSLSRKDDIILTLGAGDVWKVGRELLAEL